MDLVELFESGLQGVLIFSGRFVEIFPETIGGVMHKHLGVLDALAVAARSM